MTIQEMIEKKIEYGYTYEQIAELADLPLSTVQKVLGGVTKAPRYETLKALESVFSDPYYPTGGVPAVVNETTTYGTDKKQGEYTIKDYYALPDERRVELIDGEFFEMAAPTTRHQFFCGELYMAFREYIRRNRGQCITMTAPIDVQLDCDDHTMVQPDILILCDRSKLKDRVVYGAPDLIVEVLSKSTRKKDMFLKAGKYMNAGVKEYWLVDQQRNRVIVYKYGDEDVIDMYTFEDKIPVGIFDNKCIINFADIFEYVESLYQNK